MTAKISELLICINVIIYLLLHNLYDCTFKAKYLRYNNSHFMNRTLRRTHNIDRTTINFRNYKKQSNIKNVKNNTLTTLTLKM